VGDVVAGTTSNVVGGIVTRGAEGDSADEVLSADEISEDALSGFVGGFGGHVAADSVHLPNQMRYPTGNDRMLRARMGKYLKRQRSIQLATINQAVRAGISSSTVTHATNGLLDYSNWLVHLFFNGPRCHTEQIDISIGGQTTTGTPRQVCE